MDIRTISERLLDCVVKADRKAAALLVDQALASGMAPAAVISEILDPALVKVGVLWGTQAVSLAQSFIGAKIAEDAYLRCLGDSLPGANAEPKGIAVIGNTEDDFHSLGRRMVGTFLTAAGWKVIDLGNDVLAETFIEVALQEKASIIGASAMMYSTSLNILKIRKLLDQEGLRQTIKLAVGGAVFNWRPELVHEVGGDGTTQNAATADALFSSLVTSLRQGATP